MKRNIQSSGLFIRSLLDGKSYNEARGRVRYYYQSLKIWNTRKDFQKYGTDLSAFSDEEIERFTTYITRIMEQRTQKNR